jgi:hypothetical protein
MQSNEYAHADDDGDLHTNGHAGAILNTFSHSDCNVNA